MIDPSQPASTGVGYAALANSATSGSRKAMGERSRRFKQEWQRLFLFHRWCIIFYHKRRRGISQSLAPAFRRRETSANEPFSHVFGSKCPEFAQSAQNPTQAESCFPAIVGPADLPHALDCHCLP